MVRAFDAGPGAVKFRQPGNVEEFSASQQAADFLAHGLGRTFRSIDDLADIDQVGQAAAIDFFGQQKAHGSGAAQHGGLQVQHELALQIDISGTGREGHGAHFLTGSLEADPGRPDTVADRDLDPILFRHTGHAVTPGKEVRPIVDILLRVTKVFAFTGCSAAGVDADDLFERDAPQWKRIACA